MLECVLNASCAAPHPALKQLRAAGGAELLDLHSDRHHNRSVLTLAGAEVESAARRVTAAAVRHLDLRTHVGVHPRMGVADVVPFVPLVGSSIADAVVARDAFAQWAADELALPCFLYGPERTLPEVRQLAWDELGPDVGPGAPHPTAGACAVGAREALVAYNLWVDADLPSAKRIAAQLRGPRLRALGLRVGDDVQVSLNLIDPMAFGPADAYDAVDEWAHVQRAELVGLIPRAVLDAVDPTRWEVLDVGVDRTIEARLRS